MSLHLLYMFPENTGMITPKEHSLMYTAAWPVSFILSCIFSLLSAASTTDLIRIQKITPPLESLSLNKQLELLSF